MDFVADDFAAIAGRLRAIEAERRGGGLGEIMPGEGVSRFGIWFDPGDRLPGWCRINFQTGKWGVARPGDSDGPTVFHDERSAQAAIDSKQGGAWSTADMSVRRYA